MMNQRDLAEIRRLNPERRYPTALRGCYISGDGKLIADFAHSVGSLSQEENEKYMALLKRCLSGTAGQQLLDIDFPSETMGEEQRLLLELCDGELAEEGSVRRFYQRMFAFAAAEHEHLAQSAAAEQSQENYLVLLLHDAYDVPFRGLDGETDRERSDSVFHYLLCCVCPVRQSKPVLRYEEEEGTFLVRGTDWVVSMPEMGFMYPAFEDRGANASRALFYTCDSGSLHGSFLSCAFSAEAQMTAKEQQETFQNLLTESLEDECSLDVMQTVHETLCGMLEEQKADKTAEPLMLGKREVRKVLEDSGVSPARGEAFEVQFDETFGERAELAAVNLVTPKKFTLSTPGVSVQVDPAHTGLVETRKIDGRYYIMILADGDVEVNGVRIQPGG